jgi:hypothetical protein
MICSCKITISIVLLIVAGPSRVEEDIVQKVLEQEELKLMQEEEIFSRKVAFISELYPSYNELLYALIRLNLF